MDTQTKNKKDKGNEEKSNDFFSFFTVTFQAHVMYLPHSPRFHLTLPALLYCTAPAKGIVRTWLNTPPQLYMHPCSFWRIWHVMYKSEIGTQY